MWYQHGPSMFTNIYNIIIYYYYSVLPSLLLITCGNWIWIGPRIHVWCSGLATIWSSWLKGTCVLMCISEQILVRQWDTRHCKIHENPTRFRYERWSPKLAGPFPGPGCFETAVQGYGAWFGPGLQSCQISQWGMGYLPVSSNMALKNEPFIGHRWFSC